MRHRRAERLGNRELRRAAHPSGRRCRARKRRPLRAGLQSAPFQGGSLALRRVSESPPGKKPESCTNEPGRHRHARLFGSCNPRRQRRATCNRMTRPNSPLVAMRGETARSTGHVLVGLAAADGMIPAIRGVFKSTGDQLLARLLPQPDLSPTPLFRDVAFPSFTRMLRDCYGRTRGNRQSIASENRCSIAAHSELARSRTDFEARSNRQNL